MIVPLPSPDNTDFTMWAAQCNRCGLQRPIAKTADWLFTDEALDFHLDPHCEKRIGRQLIDSALPRRRTPLGLAVTALIAAGITALRQH